MKRKIFKLIVKYIDLKGLLTEMVTEVMDETLDKVVADTSNPYDDMMKGAMWPVAEKELAKVIADKVDVEKWLGLKEEVEAQA